MALPRTGTCSTRSCAITTSRACPSGASSPKSSSRPRRWKRSRSDRTRMTRPRIAIATGDPAGIGPEIALKATLDPRVLALCRPLLVGDPAVVQIHARSAGLQPDLHVIAKPADPDWSNGAVNLLDPSGGTNTPLEL